LESENSARNRASRKNSWHHPDEKINWVGSAGFLLVHVAGLLAFLTGVSWAAIAMCFFMYALRMFAVTGGYHRYFSHRSYKTSRWFQFVLAFLACSSGQKGVLWWAAHHRHHHKYSDTPEDIHSPILRGFWWAHVGWVLCKKYNPTREENVKDLLIYPELRWLNRNDGIAPFTLAAAIFGFGELLRIYAPGLHTNGLQMIAWGFFTSTVLLYHGTFFINSLTHMIGRQRFKTEDYSKNSFILAIITLGEGWHNNHHRYPYAESQGIYWWELDITHGILKTLSWMGLIWDLQKHPSDVYQKKVQF
jgi:stearoyl-CoA desaturase (delta-9 desaturase)